VFRKKSRPTSATRCAPASRPWWRRRAAASSCAPTARTPPTLNWPRTSPTCARPGRGCARRPPGLPATSLLHQDLSLLQRVLRDLVSEETQTIRIDSREQFSHLQAFGREFMPAAAERLQLYKGERPIFDLYSIDDEIAKALGRRVELKSGGYLIVDQTEALTTVDVNTGGFVGARNFDDTIFKTNLEAAQAIARQLRLRNLGGIIIVDFIDMGARTTAMRCWRSSASSWHATASRPWRAASRSWACWR
jgi:Rne/Rng family ribonuclease